MGRDPREAAFKSKRKEASSRKWDCRGRSTDLTGFSVLVERPVLRNIVV